MTPEVPDKNGGLLRSGLWEPIQKLNDGCASVANLIQQTRGPRAKGPARIQSERRGPTSVEDESHL